jgi:hypothetical protein
MQTSVKQIKMILFKFSSLKTITPLVLLSSVVCAQPFQNDNRSIFVVSNKLSQSTALSICNPAAQTLTNLGAQGNRKINALAYNPADNYLYAIEAMGYDQGQASITTQGKLLRINNTGSVTELGYFTYPGGTSQGKQLLSGTFDLSGNFYLYDTEDRVGSKIIYRIQNIATGNLSATTIVPDKQVFFTDFTFNPYDGFLYALGGSGSQGNSETNRIIRINPTSGATTFITPANGTFDAALKPSFYEGAGAAWSDDEANIFFYNNGGYILTYNLIHNQYTTLSTGMPNAFDADAATLISATTQKDPGVAITLTANGIVVKSVTTLSNTHIDPARDVIISAALSSSLSYTGFTVKNAAGSVVLPASNVYSIISEPASGAMNATLVLQFKILMTGNSGSYTIEMNGNRTTPNATEQLAATVQITGINNQTLNNHNLQNTGDNESWVIGDNKANNDASATITTNPLSIDDVLSAEKKPLAFSDGQKIYLDPKGTSCRYEIYSVDGKRLTNGEIKDKKTFAPGIAGIYIIKLKTGNNAVIATKVVIH